MRSKSSALRVDNISLPALRPGISGRIGQAQKAMQVASSARGIQYRSYSRCGRCFDMYTPRTLRLGKTWQRLPIMQAVSEHTP